jgi:integrase
MLSAIVERHIALHQATGYLFRKQSALLRRFARYAEAKGDGIVRASTALAWAANAPTTGTSHLMLQVVRRFATLVSAEDPRHEIPPSGVFGPRPRRPKPYIYSPEEIRALMKAAGEIIPGGSLRRKTYATLFGLLAATGLRISEALALRFGDITADGLWIRETKFSKSRLVPLHPSTRLALDSYLSERRKCAAGDDALFLSEWGIRLSYAAVNRRFLLLVRSLGIRQRPGVRGPRIHDIRHTFAVRSIEQCPANPEAVGRHMLALSTYLGHAHIFDTYWYLEATPRLLADIATRSENLAARGQR